MNQTDKITTKNGLLYHDGHVIYLPMADKVAQDRGFQHAEQLVRHLEQKQKQEAKEK